MSLVFYCFRKMIKGSSKDELRGFKVTDVNRTRKFGVACRNLQELKRKACSKLNITNDEACVNVYLLDGSQIDDDYFRTLESQTTLILQKPGEAVLSDADMLYNALRRVNIEYLTAGDTVSKYLTENLKTKIAVLNSVLNKDDTKTACSTRDEHPEWFQGLETNVHTKEAYMHRRCQERIRAYLYKSIEQIKNSEAYTNNALARERLMHAIAFFKLQLKEDHYFGFYFDRSCADVDTNNGTDEADRVDRSCYEHCPCKTARCSPKSGDQFAFATKDAEETDETDARRRVSTMPKNNSPAKRTGNGYGDNRPEEPYRYVVVRGGTTDQVALCDRRGSFKCEGIWNSDGCSYGNRHRINPYRSREELILFSTWNLDHKIERSRTLIPNLLETAEQDSISEGDVTYFYENIFTVKNLQLVHIVCHDKGAHK